MRKPLRLRLEALEDRVVLDACSVIPGNVHINFFGDHQSPSCVLPVEVKDLKGGFATSGTVDCRLVSGNQTIDLGSATVGANGIANCKINFGALPHNLPHGQFKLEEDFHGSGKFDDCDGEGTLTIEQGQTSVVPVNVTINTTNSSTPPSFTVAVSVNCATATVNSGTVTLELVAGHTIINLGTATVGANGVATITVSNETTLQEIASLPAGSYELVETYTGSSPFVSSNVTCTFTITSKSTPTTLAVPNVTINASGSSTTPPFTVAVAVNSSSATVNAGTVTLQLVTPNGTINLGTGAVGANGVATITVSDQTTLQEIAALPPGSYELVETYSGSGPFVGSSATSTLTITSTSIPTTLAVPDVTINANGSSTTPPITIAVAVNSPSAIVNAGTVTLQLITPNGPINLGTATVGPNGIAMLTVTDQTILQEIAALPLGSYELVETYSGSGPFVGSGATSTFTITTTPTTINVPPVNVNVNVNTTPAPFNITVNVNTPTGPVTSGTVTINLVNGTQTIQLGTGTPGPNGTFTINVTGTPLQTLSNLPPGTYTIIVNFNGAPGSSIGNSTIPGTLIITPSSVLPDLGATTPPTGGGPGSGSTPNSPPPLSPIQAALEIALEAAMLGNLNNPGSVGELEAFSTVFLGHAIPVSIPQLISDIQSLVPQAGPMLGPALGFGSWLDYDLPIENPMS